MAGDRAHGKHGKHRKEAITDGYIWNRLKARNYRKIDFKIIQNIKPSQMANKSHTESTEITDIKRPSQMAIYRGRYAQNFKKIEFKIIQTITDGYIYGVA